LVLPFVLAGGFGEGEGGLEGGVGEGCLAEVADPGGEVGECSEDPADVAVYVVS